VNLDRAVVHDEVERLVAHEVLVLLAHASGRGAVRETHHGHRGPAGTEELPCPALADPPGPPRDHRSHRRGEIATVLGELVDLPGDGRGQLSSGDDALALEGAEPFGEELAADPWQAIDQVGEAARPRAQLPDDQERPSIADHVERPSQGAVLLVSMFAHEFLLCTPEYTM
jgi:hypothetical protein